MSGWVMEADLGRWPATRSGRSPYRPLLRFWAALIAFGAAGAVTLQLLGPPLSKPLEAPTAPVAQDEAPVSGLEPGVPPPENIMTADQPERPAVQPAAVEPAAGPVAAPHQGSFTAALPDPGAVAPTPEPVILPGAADPAPADLPLPQSVPPQALGVGSAGATEPRSAGIATLEAGPKSLRPNARSVLARQKQRPADPVEAAVSRLRRQALSRQQLEAAAKPRPDRQGWADQALAADFDPRPIAEGSLTNRLGEPQADNLAGPSGQHWLRLPPGSEPAWDPQVGLDYIR
ncbi:MAG: hypothetical protein JOZ42_05215 [Acetobacteraceae bacterium]|nr:hypothetical protein [Acetobacteraceae bacterium]